MSQGAQLAERVMAEIEEEVAEIKARTQELKAQLPDLQRAKDAAWDEYAGPDAPEEEDKEAGRRYEIAYKQQFSVTDAIKKNGKAIEKLRSPDEFDRRMELAINQRGGIKRMTEENAKPKKATARDRGVPEEYLNAETGNFKVGADARYKSDLVSSALGLEDSSRLVDFDAKDAESRLQERGWMSFLDRKREIIKEKEAKAEPPARRRRRRPHGSRPRRRRRPRPRRPTPRHRPQRRPRPRARRLPTRSRARRRARPRRARRRNPPSMWGAE
jgi:hypothetical protein